MDQNAPSAADDAAGTFATGSAQATLCPVCCTRLAWTSATMRPEAGASAGRRAKSLRALREEQTATDDQIDIIRRARSDRNIMGGCPYCSWRLRVSRSCGFEPSACSTFVSDTTRTLPGPDSSEMEPEWSSFRSRWMTRSMNAALSISSSMSWSIISWATPGNSVFALVLDNVV
jgi:hypothetical protein